MQGLHFYQNFHASLFYHEHNEDNRRSKHTQDNRRSKNSHTIESFQETSHEEFFSSILKWEKNYHVRCHYDTLSPKFNRK